MFTLRQALKETGTKSVRGLQAALSSKRPSTVQLLQTHLIQQLYLKFGKRKRLGLPAGPVEFDANKNASRRYWGGEISALSRGDGQAFVTREVSINYLGFHCFENQGGLGTDEPYFVIAVDTGRGSPVTKTFKYENVEEGTEMGEGGFLVKGAIPDPTTIRVLAYENDEGDPDETAKEVQEELVKLSKETAAIIAGAAEGAADGPAASDVAAVGGALGGAWGAVLAVAIVGIFGMGDDFIGQNVTRLFTRPDDVKTPPRKGSFQGMDYNASIMIDGKGEGKYEYYFDVLVEKVHRELA